MARRRQLYTRTVTHAYRWLIALLPGYADGFMTHWDVFLRKVQPIASRVPYMTAPVSQSKRECAVPCALCSVLAVVDL